MKQHIKIQSEVIGHINTKKGMRIFNYKPGVFYGNIPIVYDRKVDHEELTKKTGIEIFKYYRPLIDKPNTQVLYSRIINLPIYGAMTNDDLIYLVNKLVKI